MRRALRKQRSAVPAWARVGMLLTFRAELMPGRDPEQRTYKVLHVLASGRVELSGMVGQHTEAEFEPAR
ncbi:MAG TPA: hypothetical protein VGX92_20490 [Pyrinomonadaceae bacterium]|nr:hypothetical protein [Pyrinomonadaceae bacterium]